MNPKQMYLSISQIATEAQALIDAEYAKCDGSPAPGGALDQAGLRDGKQIVLEYIDPGEWGLAVEHLVYMVSETGITLSGDSKKLLYDVASSMGMELLL